MPGILNKMKSTDALEKRRICYLIRHAETEMNEKDQVRGWTDIPLDDDTYSGLFKLGKSLKEVDGFIASDLLRTLQTAHLVSMGSQKPILDICSWLHTWNPGDYTGKSAEKIDPILEKMAVDEPYKPTPNGESFEEFKHRFLLGLIGALNRYPTRTLAFVTHGRNLACMNAWKEADYNEELELDHDHLGYDEFKPGTAHAFEISSSLLI